MSASGQADLGRWSPFRDRAAPESADESSALTSTERRRISRRVGTYLFGMGLLGAGHLIGSTSPAQRDIGELICASAALLVSLGVFREALSGLVTRPSRNYTEQLVALAVLAAFASGDFVSATLVPLLLEIGHLFEERSALGAKAAISKLKTLCTTDVTRLVNEREEIIDTAQIRVGDRLVVRPGEIIGADGTVQSGCASIDQSSVTGESTPKGVEPGADVFAGTLNLDGLLHIRVERVREDTILGEVIRVLREVEATKTPIVRMLEKAAAIYLPVVLALAATVLFVTGELGRFVTVLIVACPCALVLAAPAAMVAALSTATREGVLIKNAAFLEAVASVDTVVFDKTGTLTSGGLTLGAVAPLHNYRADEVIEWATTAAYGSRHPASRAISAEAAKRDLPLRRPDSLTEYPGKGVEATLDSETIRIGRASWLRESGVATEAGQDESGVWVARGDEVMGFIELVDHPRDEAKATVEQMRALGFHRIVLLTGDKVAVASRVASELALDDVVAEVLPSQKLDVVRREQGNGSRVLMVGDGINDALALSAADVGVAIGESRNEIAIGGADVAILSDDLTRLPFVVQLADRTRRIVCENVAIGLTFSFGMLGLAAFGVITPLAGALLHNAGAIFVAFNSSRLLEKQQTTALTGSTIDRSDRDPHAGTNE
ncbi:MAG: cation-translocating P-type ATPase [Myxococcota bacterium]